MWARRLTPDQQRTLLEEYSRGVPVLELAAQFKVHHSYPALLARRRGKETRLKRRNSRYAEQASQSSTE